MTVIELKEKLIAKINSTNDEELLDQISHVIDLEEQIDGFYKLSPDELNAVKDGIEQIESGFFFTNDEVNKLTDRCLGR